MKKLIKYYIIAGFLISVFVSCGGQNESGLIAFYPLDGNASDHSGNNNHAVIQGAQEAADRFGDQNKAVYFDGLDDTILGTVKNMPAIDSRQTIAWWFKIDTVASFRDAWHAHNMIALVDTAQGIGIQFGFRAPGYQSLGFDTWNWGGGTLLETDPPQTAKWHHCVYTFDSHTHRFYLNGKATATSTAKTQTGYPSLLMFGNYPSGDQFYRGYLDEVRIYNRTLTADEIENLFKERK